MSQIPEESRRSIENGAENAALHAGASSQEAAQQGSTHGIGNASRDKYLAIKQAVQQRQTERTEADEQAEMADRIRRMKAAKEHPDEAPYQGRQRSAHPEHPTTKKHKPSNASSRKKHGSKAASKKKRKSGGLFPRKGDSPFEVVRKTVFLLSTTVFMVCLVLIGKYFWENYQNGLKNEEIRRLVYEKQEEEKIEHSSDYEYFSLLPTAKTLLERNADTIGWIKIPAKEGAEESPINYPVLQHKDETNGNSYYLDKDFYGNYEKAGSIFMDYRNYFDYVVDGVRMYPNSQNLIIYGHNMHDYSMFGSLKYYINNSTYYDTHPIVELNSNYRRYKYKIFGMIIVEVDDTTETAFDYWNVLNFDSEEEFYDYVNEIKRRTVRLTDVDVTYGDQLLTLSTCNSTFSQGRLVVFGRLLRDGEDLDEGCTSTENPNIKWPNSYYKWHKNTYDPNAEFVPYG